MTVSCNKDLEPSIANTHDEEKYVDDSYYHQVPGAHELDDVRDDSIENHDYTMDKAETDALKKSFDHSIFPYTNSYLDNKCILSNRYTIFCKGFLGSLCYVGTSIQKVRQFDRLGTWCLGNS